MSTVRQNQFQVMPDLTTEEYAALSEDIAARGVVVPIVVDQHGRLLDGHHRRRIADGLGIDCPTEVRHVEDDEDARRIALMLNLSRRHLSREQRRELIAREAELRPDDSDRAIARRFGCSPSTVAAVRRRVSNLDTPCPVTPEVVVKQMKENNAELRNLLSDIDDLINTGLVVGVDPLVLIGALSAAQASMRRRAESDAMEEAFFEPVRKHLLQPRIDALLAVMS